MRTRTTLAWCSTELLLWAQQQTYIVCTNQCLLKEVEKSHASSPTTGRYYDDLKSLVQFSSVAQSCPTLCNPMDSRLPCPSPAPGTSQLPCLSPTPESLKIPREIPLCPTLPLYNICMYTHTHTHTLITHTTSHLTSTVALKHIYSHIPHTHTHAIHS